MPDEKYIQSLLDKTALPTETKRRVWDEYWGASDPGDFRGRFDGLTDVPNEVKHDLWNQKFNVPDIKDTPAKLSDFIPKSTAAAPPATPRLADLQTTPTQPQVTAVPGLFGKKFPLIKVDGQDYNPPPIETVEEKSARASLAQSQATAGAKANPRLRSDIEAPSERYVTPNFSPSEEARKSAIEQDISTPLFDVRLSPEFQKKHYVIAAAKDAIAGLATPKNLALMAGTSVAPSELAPLVSGFFTEQMLEGVYDSKPEIERLYSAGRVEEAKKLLVEDAINIGFAALSGSHALKGIGETARGVPVNPEIAARRASIVGELPGNLRANESARTGLGAMEERAAPELAKPEVLQDLSRQGPSPLLRQTTLRPEMEGAIPGAPEARSIDRRPAAVRTSEIPPTGPTPESLGEIAQGLTAGTKDATILTAEDPNGKILSPAENALRNQELFRELKSQGYSPIPMNGYEAGKPTNGFLVPEMTTKAALDLQETMRVKYGHEPQQSIITRQGLVDIAKKEAQPITNVRTGPEALQQPYHSSIPLGDRQVPLSFDFGEKPVPVKEPFSGRHFSELSQKGGVTLSGSRRGMGGGGEELPRLAAGRGAPGGIYVYPEGMRPEPQYVTRKGEYQIGGEKAIADLSLDTRSGNYKDPRWQEVYTKALQEAKAAKAENPGAIAVNELEHAIKEAGYDGYKGHNGAVFLFGDVNARLVGEELKQAKPEPAAPLPAIPRPYQAQPEPQIFRGKVPLTKEQPAGVSAKAKQGTLPLTSEKVTMKTKGGGAVEVFLHEAAERAQIRLRAKLHDLHAGIDPSMLGDIAIVGASKIWSGARSFKDFSTEMVKEFGERIRPYLKELHSKSRDILLKRIDDPFKQNFVKPEDIARLVKRGESADKWYGSDSYRKVAKSIFGEDEPVFTGFLAATSQGASLKTNLELALKAYGQWKTGEPFEKLYLAKKNVERVALGEEPSGPKIQEFFRTLMGQKNAKVVVDRWMSRAFGFDEAPNATQTKFIQSAVKDIAKDMKVNPSRVQAMIWDGIKKDFVDRGLGKESDVATAFGPLLTQRFKELGSRGLDMFTKEKIYPAPVPSVGFKPGKGTAERAGIFRDQYKPKATPSEESIHSLKAGFNPISAVKKLASLVGGTPHPQEPVTDPRMAEILSEQAEGKNLGKKPRTAAEFWTQQQEKYIDRFVRVHNVVRDAKKNGVIFSDKENPELQASLAIGGGAGAAELASIDLVSVASRAAKAGLLDKTNELLNLHGYDRALRIVNEKLAAAKASGDKAAEQKYADSLTNGTVVPKGYDEPAIKQALTDASKDPRYAETKKFAEEVWSMNGKMWKRLKDEGIISDATYTQGISRGPQYVPLERILPDTHAGLEKAYGVSPIGLSLSEQKVLQPLEGSELTNVNPFEASQAWHSIAWKNIWRNRAARALIDLAAKDTNGLGKQVFELKGGSGVPNQQQYGIVAYFKDGKVQRYAVPRLLADAMKNLTMKQLNFAGLGAMKFFRDILRLGATGANLRFSATNAVRDIQELSAFSKAGPQSPVDAGKMLFSWGATLGERMKADFDKMEKLRKDPLFRDYMEGGSTFSTLQKVITPERFIERKIPGFNREPFATKAFKALRVPLTSVEKLNAAVEETTKFMSYRRLRAQGLSPDQAAAETRTYGGSPDFARMGNLSPMYNLIFMFYNANVQGVDRMVRGVARNPKRIGVMLAGLGAAQIALQTWNNQFTNQDSGKPEWDHIISSDKQNYFVVIAPWMEQTPDGRWRHAYFRLPKSYALRALFNPIQDGIDIASARIAGRESPLTVSQSVLSTLGGQLPGSFDLEEGKLPISVARGVASSFNPLIKEPLEQLANFDTYRGVRIVPRSMEDLETQAQVNTNTSPVAEKIASINRHIPLFKGLDWFTSPIRVEHMTRGVLAGLADTLLTLKQSPAAKLRESSESVRELPIIGPVAGAFMGSSSDQEIRTNEEKFYDMYGQASRSYRTYLAFKGDAKKEAEYLSEPDHLVWISAAPMFQSAVETLSQLRKWSGEVMASDMAPTEKREALNAIYKARREALSGVKDIETALDRAKEDMKSTPPSFAPKTNEPEQAKPSFVGGSL